MLIVTSTPAELGDRILQVRGIVFGTLVLAAAVFQGTEGVLKMAIRIKALWLRLVDRPSATSRRKR